MSMYRPYDNVCFNNCYDFIMKSKAEKEVWELSTSLTFDDEEEMRWELDRISDLTRDIMNAEYDLCEMEMDALYDVEKYDAVLNGNIFRKGRNHKAKQNGKRNAGKAKRLHKTDRKHGKHRELTRKEQNLVHYDATKGVHGAGVWYTSRGKKVVPIVSKGAKTNRNYHTKKYDYPAKEREQEYADLFTEHGEILSYVYEMKKDLARLEREISVLEEEKRWGYLTEKGVDILEEYKEDVIQLENHIKAYKVFCNTAIR